MSVVAVIIPFYQKQPGILRRAVESVLAQDLPDDVKVQVFVVDDGSPVAAESELAGLTAYAPFTLLIHKQVNGGVAAARQAGLELASGADFIAFLDSDDVWRSDHLAKAVVALQRGYDFYFTDHSRIGHHDSHFAAIGFPPAGVARHIDGSLWDIDRGDYFQYSLRYLTAQISTVVYRRSIHPEAAFQKSLRTSGEDSLFMLQVVAKAGKVCFTNELCVTCGEGVNIYYSTFGWDDEGHVRRHMADILASYALRSKLALSETDRRFLDQSVDELYRHFAFFSLRWVLKRRQLWSPELVAMTRADPDFWTWYPLALFRVAVSYILRFFRPKELAQKTAGQDLKGCVYQEDYFYGKTTRGVWICEPQVWKNGRLVGRLPYALRRQGSLFFAGGAPSWAHIVEPILAADLNDSEKENVIRELLAQLPTWASLRFVCNPQHNDAVLMKVFTEAGFTHATQTTHLSLPSDPSVMDPENEHGLKKKRRDSIKTAIRKIDITENLSPEDFVAFYKNNLKAQGKPCYDDLRIVQNIIAKGQNSSFKKKSVVVYAARAKQDRVDPEGMGADVKRGDLVAAIVCLFDEARCYYWLSTRLQTTGFSDTVEALILHAVEKAKSRGVIFDADGVTVGGTRDFFERLRFPHTAERNIFTRDDTHSLLYRVRTPLVAVARPLVRWIRKMRAPKVTSG